VARQGHAAVLVVTPEARIWKAESSTSGSPSHGVAQGEAIHWPGGGPLPPPPPFRPPCSIGPLSGVEMAAWKRIFS